MNEENNYLSLKRLETEVDVRKIDLANNVISTSKNVATGFFSYLDLRNQRKYDLENAKNIIKMASLQLEKEKELIKERIYNREFNFKAATNEIENIQKSINEVFDLLKIIMSKNELNNNETEICNNLIQKIMELRKESKDVLSAFFNI